MKKYILIAMLFVSSFANAQSFNGIPISGTLTNAVNQYKAKGFKVSQYYESSVIMNGKVGIDDVQVFLFETPKTKQFFKMSVYFQEKSSWTSMKSEYNRLFQNLVNKYGEPDESVATFKNPYYEGDGYEMSAIQLEKCDYSALWLRKDNLNLSIDISKYKQVKMVYENVKLMEVYKTERSELNQNIF